MVAARLSMKCAEVPGQGEVWGSVGAAAAMHSCRLLLPLYSDAALRTSKRSTPSLCPACLGHRVDDPSLHSCRPPCHARVDYDQPVPAGLEQGVRQLAQAEGCRRVDIEDVAHLVIFEVQRGTGDGGADVAEQHI